MSKLNEALLWLAGRQGRISFGVNSGDKAKGLDPSAAVINVEAKIVTVEETEDGSEFELRHCTTQIMDGNVVDALLAAINLARYGPSDTDDPRGAEMVDEGDPNAD